MLFSENGTEHLTLDSFSVATCKPLTPFSATTDTRGDFDGAAMPFTLFTVTGDVLVRLYGVCTTTLVSAGGGTISVGVANNTAKLIASTTAANITTTANFWADATPYDSAEVFTKVTGPYIILNGANIIETIGTADITAGNIYYNCLWRPLSHDGKVVSAV